MTLNGNIVEGAMLALSNEEKFNDLIFVMAYEHDIKPTPVTNPIVALSTKGGVIGPKLTKTLDTGEVVSTKNREIETTISIDIYLPYSMGGNNGHKIFDRIATYLMYETAYSITKATCYETEYDKSCQAIVLKSNFVFSNIASS